MQLRSSCNNFRSLYPCIFSQSYFHDIRPNLLYHSFSRLISVCCSIYVFGCYFTFAPNISASYYNFWLRCGLNIVYFWIFFINIISCKHIDLCKRFFYLFLRSFKQVIVVLYYLFLYFLYVFALIEIQTFQLFLLIICPNFMK